MMKNNTNELSGYTSIMLDSLRLLAAFAVLLVHTHNMWISAGMDSYNYFVHVSHTGVVVFFVLSGYVISYTTSINNRGPVQYFKARFSRLYSMLIPALLLSLLVLIMVAHLSPSLYTEYSRGTPWLRFLLCATYLNEFGFFSAAIPIDKPLWSLSYEFWYYIIFGLFIFRKNNWISYLSIVLACIIAGPKILIMMPIWLAGCFAYKSHLTIKNHNVAWIITFASLAIAILIIMYVKPYPNPAGIPPLFYSNPFISDYLLGLFIALALWIMPVAKPSFKVYAWAKSFRKVADLTFPIYVLHQPLLVLWLAVFGYHVNNYTEMWLVLISVLLTSALLGLLLEKHRALWSNFFGWIMNWFYVKVKGSSYFKPAA